jgi:multicomponent Na+:H+ antiporter subunit B
MRSRTALIVALLALVAVPLLYAVAELPPYGSASAPAYTHVSPRYLERGPEEAGAENIVTDVILNYRGFDTNFEVTVIFTAMVGVLAVLLTGGGRRAPVSRTAAPAPSLVVRFIVRVMAPLIAMFAVYVVLHGHVSPGGGFQGGTIAGALFIALSLVLDEDEVGLLWPRLSERLLQGAAPLTFLLVGTVGGIAFGSYLQFPGGVGPSARITLAMLTVIEFGIGIGGAMVVATIFRTMGGDRW